MVIKSISFVSISFIFTYLFGYLFHFFVSRKLGPVGYGEFMVLNSLFLTIGNVTGILSTIVVKSVLENLEYEKYVLRFLRILSLILGLTFFLLGVVFSPFIKEFLNLTYTPYIWIVAFCWIFLFINAVEKAYLQATERFGIFSFSVMFEIFLKVVLSYLLLLVGFYTGGVLLGILLSLIFTFSFLVWMNKNIFGKIRFLDLKKLIKVGAYASPAGFLIYADDIFIRRVFDPEVAGFFASSSIIGKAFLGLCLTFLTVFFPKFIKYKDKPLKFLYFYILLVSIIFFIGEIGVISFGKYIFLVVFGKDFVQGFEILKVYLIAILPLALILGFIYLFIAVGKGLYLIYTHLLLYFSGFIILPIKSLDSYLIYIFTINFTYFLIYILFSFLYIKAGKTNLA